MSPPRVEAEITILDTLVNIHTNVERHVTEVVGSGGSVVLTITSRHDEVMQGEFAPAGHIDIWLKKDPSLWKRLNVRMLRPTNATDVSLEGMLTLFPGKRIKLEAQWGHRDSAGIPFWRHGERTYVTPPIGYPYYETEPLQFEAEGTAQLFGEQGAIYAGRIQFTLIYRESIIGGGDTLAFGRVRGTGGSLLEIQKK